MATLTNTKIKDTYDGLLKTTDNEALDVSGVTLIEDGLGNASALSVGRSGNGVSVSGLLDVSGEVQGTSLDINGAADISGNLAVDTNTLYVDAANNQVGIGTSSPTSIAGFTALTIDNSGSGSFIDLLNSGSDSLRFLALSTIDQRISGQGTLSISSGSSSDMVLNTGGSEAMRIDSSGNVGIGVTPKTWSVGTALEVARNGSAIWSNGQGETNIMANIYYDGGYKYAATGAYGARINVGNTNGNILFYTDSSSGTAGSTSGATERMRIDSSGNVGIGESNPSVPFHLSSNNGSVARFSNNSATSTTTYLTVINTNNTSNGTVIAHIDDGTSYIGNQQNAALRFVTNDTERMRITSGGSVGIGVQSWSDNKFYVVNSTEINTIKGHDQNASTTSDGIIVAVANRNTTNNTFYAYSYYNIGSGAFRFRVADSGNVTNTNNSYGAISDIKVKENIVDATPKLDDLLQVKIRNFNYIGSEEKQLGVVAQELEEVFPSMIDESPDFEEREVIDEEGNVTKERVDLGTTTKSVKYSVFVPMLIKAMQEQQEIINDLKARIETLEAK